jgi:F-type H+-transporting ATPase subunit c
MSKKGIFLLVVLLALCALPAFGQQPAEAAGGAAPSGVRWGVIGAAFTMGFAAAFGALAQGRATSAACEGLARNPGAGAAIRLMAILGLAFIESLVIYALVLAFTIKGT